MQRRIAEIAFAPQELAVIKEKMLNWSSRFGISLFLDSNTYPDQYGQYECLLGAGAIQVWQVHGTASLQQMQAVVDQSADWLFGHLGYDLKNMLEAHLQSRHEPMHGWAALQLFRPEVVCIIERGSAVLRIEVVNGNPEEIAASILDEGLEDGEVSTEAIRLQSRFSEREYVEVVAQLREHIRNGDCYEINFCNEAFADGVSIDTRRVFRRLSAASPAPFAAFYQDKERTMICASPERFLRKRGMQLLSQPIKGTARRSLDAGEDRQLANTLRNNEKEQAENVMIVDLVRNDLSRSCVTGSIRVEELFGIYSFPQVHQMISTISGALRQGQPLLHAICDAFPMGSMTGAPKHMVMQLIDRYEKARRELFSGAVGYINPQGDFDFNVVIRSLFYNAEKQYLSYQTGGAITWGSDPKMEWEELRLKAKAIEQILA